MPKETFFKLPEEKKIKIINAAKKEFTRVPFNETSIKNIVEDAQIARGSFYQYFESKEDILSYLMKKHVEMLDKQIVNTIKESNGDIFEVFIKMYDTIVKECSNQKDVEFYKQIFKNVKTCEDTIFSDKILKIKPREFSEYYKLLDIEKINIQNEKDLDIISNMLFTITRRAIITSFKDECKQISRNKFLRQIEYLKYGILKNGKGEEKC